MIHERRFESGSADLRRLRAASDAESAAVLGDVETRQSLEEAGISVQDLPESGVFEIKAGSSGFDISGADVIIGIGGWAAGVLGDTAKEILLDIWRDKVKPRIERRLGDDAVGPEKD